MFLINLNKLLELNGKCAAKKRSYRKHAVKTSVGKVSCFMQKLSPI